MSHGVRFVLDGRVREVRDVDPTLTVLQWLRGDERRCGTKEGCAEGDCGACTVVLGDLDGDRLRLRAVNACLVFLPVLDGKALFTVESLGGAAGGLHPVQEALVECHGSQCGFCTPGFVMSLFALYEGERGLAPTRRRLDDVLAGNLCRCTGYRPIVAAARRAWDRGDRLGAAARDRIAGQLRALRRQETLEVVGAGRRFLAPRTLAALAELVARHPEAHLLAGGTDLGLRVTKQHQDLGTVISLAEVAELRRLAISPDHLELGAAVTYAEAQPALAALAPDLGELVRRIGSTQIRNLGTIGGNVANASPIGDMPPALLALGATLLLRRGAERRELPLDRFFLGYRKTALAPGELVEALRVPRPPAGARFHAYKVSKRFDQDISAVCAAFLVTLERGRVRALRAAFGGMAAVPRRAPALEAALVGGPWTPEAVEAALPSLDAELTPIGDLRASAAYRRLVARNLVKKLQLETSGATAPTRVLDEPAAAPAGVRP